MNVSKSDHLRAVAEAQVFAPVQRVNVAAIIAVAEIAVFQYQFYRAAISGADGTGALLGADIDHPDTRQVVFLVIAFDDIDLGKAIAFVNGSEAGKRQPGAAQAISGINECHAAGIFALYAFDIAIVEIDIVEAARGEQESVPESIGHGTGGIFVFEVPVQVERVEVIGQCIVAAGNDADFFDYVSTLGVESITISPGYAYERAPDQEHFLSRQQTKNIFRDVFRMGRDKGRKWQFNQSTLYLDFLAGNQQYECTPWGNPTRNIFGWQKPCYLVGEGYVRTFKELMETTDWDSYGTGKYEKCANCMVHCGYEPTAVADTVSHPLKALKVYLRGIDVDGPISPEIYLSKQLPADYVFEKQVDDFMAEPSPPREAAE